MRKKNRLFIIALLATGFSSSAYAQSANQDSVSIDRELTLEKEYSPSLDDAFKINQLPEIKEPEAPKSKVEFSNYTIPYSISPYLSILNPSAYFTDLATTKQRGYVNAGLSSLLDVNGDLGYQILNNDKDYLSIFASHRSSSNKVSYLQNDEKQRMKINDNLGGINYSHNFEKVKFMADAQYLYSAFNYYGVCPIIFTDYSGVEFDPGFDMNKNQANNMLQTHLGVSSIYNEDVSYKVNLAHTLFNQKYGYDKTIKGRTENRIMADADLRSVLNSTTEIGVKGYVKSYLYKLPEDYIPLQSNITHWRDNNGNGHIYNIPSEDESIEKANKDYTTLSASPYLTFEGGNWNAQVGLSVNAQVGGTKEFLIAPDMHFNFHPIDKLRLYVLAEGGIKDNSNYNMYYENRYIAPQYRIRDSRSPLDATLGIEFSPLPSVSMGLFTGYKITNDEHLYISKVPSEYFYDDVIMGQFVAPQYVKAETFKLGGSIRYAYQDIFNVGLKLAYYKWNTKKSKEDIDNPLFGKSQAWNKPNFVSDLNMGFKVPTIPLRFDLTYHLETGRKHFEYFTDEKNMKDIHDLSVKGTYTINKTVSVYAATNNLLFQKYDLWYGYPAQGFNIMGGLNVRF